MGFSISWESIYHQGLSSLTCTVITDWDSGGCNAHCKGNSDPCLSSDSRAAHVQHHLCLYLIAMQGTAPTLAVTVALYLLLKVY